MAPDGGLDRFLSWRQVRDLTGLGRTTAWRLRRAGDFPDPVPISPGRVAWRARDIATWNASRDGAVYHPLPLTTGRAPIRPPEPATLSTAADAVLRSGREPVAAILKPARKRRPVLPSNQLGFDF